VLKVAINVLRSRAYERRASEDGVRILWTGLGGSEEARDARGFTHMAATSIALP
jgi:hypothetical protein